jgi:DNA-directed RNA polymerase
MGLDATNSGLQIMGVMSGCIETCKATNLIFTGERVCGYQMIADTMNAIPGVSVDRDTVKKPVMTTFYGSTAQPKQVFGTGSTLAAFYTALEEQLPGAYDLMDVLQQQWNSYATEHQWTLPDGHIARVPVTQTIEKSIEIDECNHMRFAYRANVIAPVIRSRSLAANIVHSIDGWIVRQMVSAAHQQGFWLAPIHDCFYTSPNNMDKVRQNYLTIMQWLADNNQVSKILSEIKGSYVPYTPMSSMLSTYMKDSEYALS